MPTTLTTIPSDIIHNHILPRLDGPSLSAIATVSPHLHRLCSDDSLWADVTRATWPSVTHPRVDYVISTFPSRHRSFFADSFPALVTDTPCLRCHQPPPPTTVHPPSTTVSPPSTTVSPPSTTISPPQFNTVVDSPEFISAVDIRYRNDVVYSAVQFTDTSPDFLSSELRIGISDDPTCNQSGFGSGSGSGSGFGSGSGSGSGSNSELLISRPIDVEVDELAGADLATLSDLEQSITLSWIIIDPTRKRAGNLSSIKPVSVRQDWMGHETVLKFVTVLAGPDPNEMVKCKIRVVLGVNVGEVGLHVRHVGLKLEDLSYRCLNGREVLVVLQGAILGKNNVRRKVLDDKERCSGYWRLKAVKKEIKECERVEEVKRGFEIKMNYVFILVSFSFSIYFLMLLLQ